jgi:RNA polymerase sigma factor (sigma-70 family)
MAGGVFTAVLQYLRRLTPGRGAGDASDELLLERFVTRREEAAFAALLHRHGPLVLAVCHSILRNTHDAEDAFQATFLIFAHKARSIAKRASLGSWLHGVAYRVAVRAKAKGRRRLLPRQGDVMAAQQPPVDPEREEVGALLHEEVNRLPEKYRTPIVLCYLEGRTREEAAASLRCSEATVKGRLERARDLLRARLTRRGVALSAGLFVTALSQNGARAAVSATLAQTTVRAVLLVAQGQPAAGVISAEVAALVEGVRKAMFMTKLRIVAAVALAVGLLGTGAGLVTRQVLAAGREPVGPAGLPKPADPETGVPEAPTPPPQEGEAGKAAADPAAAEQTGQLAGHTGPVLGVACAPDGKLVATASADKTVKLWDVATKKEIATLQGHTGDVTAVAFSPDARLLASASADKTAKLWDLAARKELRTFQGHTGPVTAVAFTPDGRILGTGSADKSVRLWDVASGREIRQIQGHAGAVTALAFTPDGRRLATTGADKGLDLWEMDTGKQILRIRAHTGAVTAIALSPDGRKAATAGADKTAKLWDLAGGQQVATLEGHTGEVRAVAFNAAGTKLATAGAGKTVRIWEVATGKQLAPLKGHEGAVTSLVFGPDARTLFSGSADKTVRVWVVPP